MMEFGNGEAKMEAKVATLVKEVASIRTTLVAMQQKADDNQKQLLMLLTQGLPKQQLENDEEGSVLNQSSNENPNNEDGGISSIPGWMKLDGKLLDEFCLTTKKVELLLFNNDDLAEWIACAEIYFHVMGTNSGVRVNLTHLCMEGTTIHFFNSLLYQNLELTWERFTNELLERYGSTNHGDVFEQLSNLQQFRAWVRNMGAMMPLHHSRLIILVCINSQLSTLRTRLYFKMVRLIESHVKRRVIRKLIRSYVV